MIHIAVWGAGDAAETHVRSFLKYSGRCKITAVINHKADRAEADVLEADVALVRAVLGPEVPVVVTSSARDRAGGEI